MASRKCSSWGSRADYDDDQPANRPSDITVYEDAEPWRGIGIINPSTGREMQGWFGSEPIGFLYDFLPDEDEE